MTKVKSIFNRNRYSIGFWIFIIVSAYFGFSLYWAVVGVNWIIELTKDSYVFQQLSKGPAWWMIMYYASEGLSNSIAGVFRAVAGFFAIYSSFLFLRKKENAFSLIRGKVGTALMFEAFYVLFFLPITVASFSYYLADGSLYYFDHTPGAILLYVTALPNLLMTLVLPPLLLKLRSKIIHSAPREEIIKWSCLSGVSYLFVAFGFNYSMAWLGNMVPYTRGQGQFGLSFLLAPVNLASFTLTVLGLFLIALSALWLTFPAIMKRPVKLSYRWLGVIMTAFGGYFVFSLLYYYLTGGYAAHPNVWYEIIGPLHNPNLWCITFLFLGLALLAISNQSDRSV